MVVRARSFAALAIAAAPVAAAHASVAVPPSTLGTPSFNCAAGAVGGTIDWSDGVSFAPSIGLTSDLKIAPEFTPLPCSDGGFGVAYDKQKTDPKEIVIIKTTDKSSPTLFEMKLNTDNPFDLKLGLELKYDGELKFYNSFYDVTLNFLKYDVQTGGFLGNYKEFVGFKFDNNNKFITDGTLKLDNGQVVFDPELPEGTTNISLYATPQANVPEPGSLVMLGTGLLGIGAAVRRRLGW